jgi:hypothetical protein
MAECAEFLVYREIKDEVKKKYGPHHVWLRGVQFDSCKFDIHESKKWLDGKGFDGRIKKGGTRQDCHWFDVDDYPNQPAETWLQRAGQGIVYIWAIVREGELCINKPYTQI